MESLNIKGDKKSPAVAFEPYSGLLVMKGKSSLENPGKFYDRILDWINNYSKQPAVKTTFRMEMEYFNSSSAKFLMKLFRSLEEINKGGRKQVSVEWCFEGNDQSMQESGEDFNSMLKLDFKFVELN